MAGYKLIFANGCTDEAVDLAISRAKVIVTEKIVLDYPKYVEKIYLREFIRKLSDTRTIEFKNFYTPIKYRIAGSRSASFVSVMNQNADLLAYLKSKQ